MIRRLFFVSLLAIAPSAVRAEFLSSPGTCEQDGTCVATENVLVSEELEMKAGVLEEMKNLSSPDPRASDSGMEELYDDEEEDEEEDDDDDSGSRLGIEFGVGQTVESEEFEEEVILAKIEESTEYYREFAATQDFFVKIRGDCRNEEESCTVWALEGECEKNPDYMVPNCGPACQMCEPPPQGPGSEFGVVQNLQHENFSQEDVWAALNKTQLYVKDTIMVDEFYNKVRKLCFNQHEDCTIWALEGECEGAEEEDVIKQCAPACQKCEQLHYETRCPFDPESFPNVYGPGDIKKMFHRIVTDPEYNATVHSRPDYLDGDTAETASYRIGPWIISIDDFITPEEASHLIEWGHNMTYERSEEVGGIDPETGEAKEGIVSTDRTSTNSWCERACKDDSIVKDIFVRIQKMTGVPPENSEHLQLLRYEPNQYYLTHHDYIPQSSRDQGGPRILTVFMYLNEVEEGGETRFDYFDENESGKSLLVKPRLGRVAMWPSVLDEDPSQKDKRTYHEAMPVTRGIKYAANAWLHLRNFQQAMENGC